MRTVMVVDDDTIVRITLRSMVDWGRYGYEIIGDASNGEQALEWLENHSVDLLITDMKMPIMDGLKLIQTLKSNNRLPYTVVLSSYDDFGLVRESFRLGAEDYLLKSDINEQVLTTLLEKLNESHFPGCKEQEKPMQGDGENLVDMILGKKVREEELFHSDYFIVRFEIDDFLHHVSRFGTEIKSGLVEPFMEFARQIPRVSSRCIVGSISPSQYVMLYRIADLVQSQDNVVSTCNQLKNVWSNYMNLPVSAGISSMGKGVESIEERFHEAGRQLELHYLTGKATVCYPWKVGQISEAVIEKARENCMEMLRAICTTDELVADEERQRLFTYLESYELKDAKEYCIAVIYLIMKGLRDTHYNIWDVFQEPIDYYEKMKRLMDSKSMELWMNNYLRWVLDYQMNAVDHRQADLMVRARRFIGDNYANPELTLGSVAKYAGLNEKYFSSRFTKEIGNTFSNYLTEVRIKKAKELMDQTDLKIYEISQKVGYNNVEHFTRMFKKVCKISPGSYKKMDNL